MRFFQFSILIEAIRSASYSLLPSRKRGSITRKNQPATRHTTTSSRNMSAGRLKFTGSGEQYSEAV
jgi:hypothetical protein